MPIIPQNHADHDAAHGSTAVLFDTANANLLTGAGAGSIGANGRPPLSIGVSNIGGGPTAVAAAGEAVALSEADAPGGRNAMGVLNRLL